MRDFPGVAKATAV